MGQSYKPGTGTPTWHPRNVILTSDGSAPPSSRCRLNSTLRVCSKVLIVTTIREETARADGELAVDLPALLQPGRHAIRATAIVNRRSPPALRRRAARS